MGNQSAARLHGDDYQHLYSWLKILDLLDPNTYIDHIWVEAPTTAAAVDDVTIHPKDPAIHSTQYYQLKGHMDLSKNYSMEKLTEPTKKGLKSLLQSLWDSWKKICSEQQGDDEIEIWLVSDWQADPFLGGQIRNNQFKGSFFADLQKTRTDVIKECEKWKNHLSVNDDDEFLEFCSALRFELGYQSNYLWDLVQARMRSFGLKCEDADIRNGIGIVREWIKEGRRQSITTNQLLKKLEQENLQDDTSRRQLPIQKIEESFKKETDRTLNNIRLEIDGIGKIERNEINEIEGQLKQQQSVVLVGEAGTGKSGIAAMLTKSAWDGGKIVLLLDARTISHVYDEAQLKQYLGLDHSLDSAIEAATDYKGCRIIVDQLDNVIGSRTGDLLVRLISDWKKLTELDIVVISRRDIGRYGSSNEVSRLIKIGFVEQTSKLLDEVTTREALSALGISSPNSELVELTRYLLNLEIISLIKQESPAFSEFSTLTNKITLWEKYLESIVERESIGSGTNYAIGIIEEAERISRTTLRNGQTEFALDARINQSQSRLIGTILVHLSGNMYRFRHEELQYFLYAKGATECGQMPLDVNQDIHHNVSNVLPMMEEIYLQQSGNSEYKTALYKQFMQEGCL